MAKLLISAAAAALFASGAIAADLPSYEAPPVLAPVPDEFSWTGFYGGLQAGYSWGDLESNVVLGNGEDEEFDAEGIVGGIFVGANYEFLDAYVVGIEGDFEGTGIDSDGDGDGPGDYSADLNFQGSVRGRVGFAADRFLLYATAGIAFADFDTELDGVGRNTDNDGTTEVGWTAGAGADYALTDNIFLRGEYRYSDLADFDNEDDFGDVQDLESHTVRGGIGFKF